MSRGWWLVLVLVLDTAACLAAALHPVPYAPHCAAAVLGASVGFIEVLETFPSHAWWAFRNGWGWALVLLNGLLSFLATAVALAIYHPASQLLAAILVSLTLPVVLRTRFTVLKGTPGGTNDLELDLGQIYDRVHAVCYSQADRALQVTRQREITRLVERFPVPRQMHVVFLRALDCLSTLSDDDRDRACEAAEALVADDVAYGEAVRGLAKLVVDYAGPLTDDLLTELDAAARGGPPERETRATALAAESFGELRARLAACSLTAEQQRYLERLGTTDDLPTRQQAAALLVEVSRDQ